MYKYSQVSILTYATYIMATKQINKFSIEGIFGPNMDLITANTITAIANHPELFQAYAASKYEKYCDLASAVHWCYPTKTIILFIDFALYALVDEDEHRDFINNYAHPARYISVIDDELIAIIVSDDLNIAKKFLPSELPLYMFTSQYDKIRCIEAKWSKLKTMA